MSGSNYFKDQDELAAAVGLSTRQVRKYTSLPGFPSKAKSGYPRAKCVAFIREQQSQGLQGDGTLKDEKLKREIERLDIIIQKELDELTDRKETERAYLTEIQSFRAVIEDWRAHETAKNPAHVKIIGQLADNLITRIRERSEVE